MKKKRFISLLLVLVLVMYFIAGCAKDAKTQSNTSPDDKTVVIYCASIMSTLNPFLAAGYSDRFIATNVYETLVTVDNSGNIQPMLAESWEISDDALTYTFKLVKGAMFHNGETVKASDVAFTYEYAKNYPFALKYIEMVDTVKALDENTVQFTLKYPSPLFLPYAEDMHIFCEKFVTESDDPDVKSVECGSGPYKVTSFDGSNHCYLEAFEDYRGGAPSIKKAEFRYISDASSAVVALEAGEITIMDTPIAQGKVLMDSGKWNHQIAQPYHTTIIAMNCKVPPFDNKLVRQAFSYAADKESIIKIAYEGFGTPARIQAGTNCFGVDFSESPDISYNPEKAKELLAEAGYPNGLNLGDFGIKFKIIAGGYFEKLGQAYHQNLAAIGVKVEMISTETPDEDAVAGDFAIMTEGLSYRADFSGNQWHYCTKGIGGSNFNQWSDPYVDEMFEKADYETDPEVRKDIYRKLIAYIIDACPSVPIMHGQSIYVWNKSLNASVYDNPAHPYRIYEWSWND